jgi:hypothetical protein
MSLIAFMSLCVGPIYCCLWSVFTICSSLTSSDCCQVLEQLSGQSPVFSKGDFLKPDNKYVCGLG